MPIIGCGGVTSIADMRALKDAGAQIFGVGSALTGLDSEVVRLCFSAESAENEYPTIYCTSGEGRHGFHAIHVVGGRACL